jgi:hypothetical protein
MLSKNRVVGWSIDFPIARTCAPSKVCVDTCYAAKTTTAATAALLKQQENMQHVVLDPEGSAHRIVAECRASGATFLRWNGAGDLFPEAVRCLNTIGAEYPDVPVWVVTRKPADAQGIADAPNVFVHLSIDRATRGRLREWLNLPHRPERWFASYQCDRGEDVDVDALARAGFSVVFRDDYAPLPATTSDAGRRVSCPLNGAPALDAGCLACGRCWTPAAVTMRNTDALRAWANA